MRYVCATALVALAALIPSESFAQGPAPGLSITNYQLVSETRFSRTHSDLVYRADIVNTGAARTSVTATATSTAASVQVIEGILHFSNVPANGQVTSTDTFTIRVDRTVAFNFASLQWTFSPPANPVANAGPNQTAAVGSTVTLNGSGSSNPGGVGTLTYSWVFTTRPAGSGATLNNPTSVAPTFVLDRAGTYEIALTVSNGVASDTDSVTVSTTNSAPVANAGPNQTVAVGATVTLNGSGSSDVDGNPLTYSWTLTSRPPSSAAVLAGASTVAPTFVADKAGTYVARLIVNDGTVSSAPSTVTITTSNTGPVANAGPNQTVNVGAVVQLNGSGSTDVDGNPLTYQWSLINVPSGSTASLSSATAVNPTFTADRPGTYVAQLIVNDGTVNSAADTVSITTSAVQAPTANAGPNQTVKHGSLVTLSGSGTDPQARPLTFLWSLINKPAGSTAALSSTTVANPTFVADLPGSYVAQLIVNNGFVNSAPDTVTITTTNTAPVANAGPNQNVTAGALVTLNGSASSDADGDALSYSWSFTSRPSGSTATLSAANSPSPTFTASLVGTYVVQLIVNDGFANSTPKTVTITAAAGAAGSIVATSGSGQSAQISTAFANRLVATVKDAGGNPVSGVTVTFTAPAAGASGTFASGANTAVTNGLGVATSAVFTANSSAGGPYTVSVSVPGVATPATFSLTNTTGPVGSITTTSGSGQSAQISTAFANRLVATVVDAGGNPVSGVTVTFAVPSSGASGSFANGLNTAVTNGSGVATSAVFTANSTAGGPYNVSASVAGVSTPALFALTNTAGPAASITATSGSGQSVQIGTAFANRLVATVKDAGGNPLNGVTVTFTAPATGARGTFAGGANTAVTNTSGVATSAVFTANNTAGGPYSVSASVTGVATPATFALTNTVGPPASITATSGSGQSAQISAAFANPLVATVKDAGGNPLSGVTVTFAAPGSGASGSFAGGANTAVTNASGVATSAVFTANSAVGAYNVSVSTAGVATPATFALTNTVGPPASITATSGTPQSAAINAPFANRLVATVRDAGGNPVNGVTVTFTAPATGARGTFASGLNTAVTNASGVATSAVFTANNTVGGPYNVVASVAGVGTPATFALTNTVGPPASITATSGTPQSALVGTAFANRLVATVKDAGGNLLNNVTVTFAAPSSGASGSFAGGANTAVTNAAGVATSAVFTANGTAGGPYTVSASVAGVATPATFSLTNTVVISGPLSISGATVGQNLQTTVTLSLPQPAPVNGVNVTITSSNSNLVRLAKLAGDTGTPSVVVNVPQGQTTVTGIFVQSLAGSGTAQITASASGYTDGTATITLSPAGFVLVGPGGIGVASFNANQGTNNTVLTVSASRLDSSLNLQETQQVRGGLTVNVPISTSNSTVGTVSPTSVSIVGGNSTATTNFNALSPGSTVLTASVPPGFSQPASGLNTVVGNVLSTGLLAPNVTVGQNLETNATIRLNSPAPSTVTITVSSNDAAKLLFSLTPEAAGSPSINLTIQSGATGSPQFFVQALASTGSATYSATGSGFGSTTGTVTFGPSGFLIEEPGTNFQVTSGDNNVDVNVVPYLLNPNLTPFTAQRVRGGLTVNVAVQSSNQSAGVITVSPIVFTGGSSFATTQFDPIAAGTTTISVVTPTGFSNPSQDDTRSVTVITPNMVVTSNISIGKNLQAFGTVLLGQPAPQGGLQVMLTSNSALLKLSSTETAAGSASITLTIPEDESDAIFFIQALGDTGTVTYTAAASGFPSRTGTISLAPSGVVIAGPSGFGFPLEMFLADGPQPVSVFTARLEPGTNEPLEQQALAGGMTLPVSLTNSNPAVGTIPGTLTIPGGSDNAVGQFTPLAVGSTVISVLKPADYTQPTRFTTLSVTVAP